MTKELIIKTKSLFKSAVYQNDLNTWHLAFEDNIIFNIETTLWRLLKKGKIKRVSTDHKQQFGLPAPIDLVKQLNSELKGKYLLKIQIQENTGDLLLTLSDNLQIEIFIYSGGYESYNFRINREYYVAMGCGEIAIWDNQ